jgi:hypothetical protein
MKYWTSTDGKVTATVDSEGNVVSLEGSREDKAAFIESFGTQENAAEWPDSELDEYIEWIIDGDILDGSLDAE